MSKSLKLKNDTYIDSSSINYKRKNLEQFLVNRFTLNDINIGKLTDFNQQYGYKQVSIKVPANSIMIVTFGNFIGGFYMSAYANSLGEFKE